MAIVLEPPSNRRIEHHLRFRSQMETKQAGEQSTIASRQFYLLVKCCLRPALLSNWPFLLRHPSLLWFTWSQLGAPPPVAECDLRQRLRATMFFIKS